MFFSSLCDFKVRFLKRNAARDRLVDTISQAALRARLSEQRTREMNQVSEDVKTDETVSILPLTAAKLQLNYRRVN